MARMPEDARTHALDLGPDVPPPAPPAEALPEASSPANDPDQDAHLAAEFSLVRVRAPVYIQNPKEAAQKTANANRVAKHRAKLAEQNMKPTAVPSALLDEVKTAGGWDKWKETQKPAPAEPKIERVEIPGPERIVEVEKIVEKKMPVELGNRDKESIRLGRAVQNLTGWRKSLVFFALGATSSEK